MLQVEGKKMSKSLGNFFTVRDLLDQKLPNGEGRYAGEVIRLVYLGTHYGKPMDWTSEKAEQAKATLRKWAEQADPAKCGLPDPAVVSALCDDLNTSAAISELDRIWSRGDGPTLTASADLLGFDLNRISQTDWATPFKFEFPNGTATEGRDFEPTVGLIGWGNIAIANRDICSQIIRKWLKLRRESDWHGADHLKSLAAAAGLELQAKKSVTGTTQGLGKLHDFFDPSKLQALQ
jgi:cysteinyl-tRNA synthetase